MTCWSDLHDKSSLNEGGSSKLEVVAFFDWYQVGSSLPLASKTVSTRKSVVQCKSLAHAHSAGQSINHIRTEVLQTFLVGAYNLSFGTEGRSVMLDLKDRLPEIGSHHALSEL